ncbi:2-dehydro-3-deoxygalactonokinase [Desulfosediminicola flagellatus]|uniref:2-dehydro-3-deoxygalactonokinase n=1 Tax=Desulfosediminicola flagellatus TaxID=2569541 RepID=UPI00142EC391|nr:2-dehydro-3-deoxygalactonokinase [Desulfosediminicola flagellatus]
MANLIALDWGTTSFRAYFLNEHGNILCKVNSEAGILCIENGKFLQTLCQQLKQLGTISPGTPIVAAGMITSRQGWVETDYVECPASPEDLALNLSHLDTEPLGRIWFVPGVKQLTPHPDIMRGEETQLAGITQSGDQVVILPGTHSKWVNLHDGILTSFSTFMTGDLFNAVRNHTILRAITTASWSPVSFRKGVDEGYNSIGKGKGLLSSLFQTRVKDILGLSEDAGTESYLSGILIGTEIGEALKAGYTPTGTVCVLAEPHLTELYLSALEQFGITAQSAPADVSAYGLFRIARLKQLI